MDDLWARLVENMQLRIDGPFKFRLILQPLMASIFAVRGGLKDVKAGRPPYLWGVFHDPAERSELLREGWKGVGKVFVLAVLLEVVFQLMVLKTVYPLEAVFVALVLAILPYLVLRGFTNRLSPRR
jgi:hypothetical protein